MKPPKRCTLLLSLLFGIVFISCGEKKQKESVENFSIPSDTTFQVNFAPFPPKDLAPEASYSELIEFVWEEFISLNWKSSYEQNSLRAYPDTLWNWSSDRLPFQELLVWETYAHRTELRPHDGVMRPFDSPPFYSYSDSVPISPSIMANGKPAIFTLFNNLDENNEIGSCNLYAHVGTYGEENRVIYQAKVNRDEYEYVLNNYPTDTQLSMARNTTKTNIQMDSAYYKGAINSCNCPKEENVICLPCGGSAIPGQPGKTYEGAIEIKTAWRLLVKEDDATKFFTRNVITYEKKGGTIYYYNKTLALIGMHIIHKTTNYPDFIFATWEHNGVEEDDMGYILLDKNDKEIPPLHTDYPRGSPISDLVKQSTEKVHEQIQMKNPKSIWLNYHLVGVQATPTNDTKSPDFYLANYVVESDPMLAHFRGSSIANPFDSLPNSLLNKKFYSMGGCMGCHGATQLKGTDFSFLLDNVNRPVKSPDVLVSLPGDRVGKLQEYINAMR